MNCSICFKTSDLLPNLFWIHVSVGVFFQMLEVILIEQRYIYETLILLNEFLIGKGHHTICMFPYHWINVQEFRWHIIEWITICKAIKNIYGYNLAQILNTSLSSVENISLAHK